MTDDFTSSAVIEVAPVYAGTGYNKPTLRIYGSVVELTKGVGGSQADSANNTKNNPSDPAIKENIVKIGEHLSGFGLYLFDYKPEYRDHLSSSRQFGVMADEVEKVLPQAVSRSELGYKQVDYAQIGVIRSIH